MRQSPSHALSTLTRPLGPMSRDSLTVRPFIWVRLVRMQVALASPHGSGALTVTLRR